MIRRIFVLTAIVILCECHAGAQPSSLPEAEDFVLGTWQEQPPERSQGTFFITIETGRKTLVLYRNHTAMLVIPPVLDNKERRETCTWVVRRDDVNNEYYLEVTQGRGFQMIWKYRFDRLDYLIDDFGVRYAKR